MHFFEPRVDGERLRTLGRVLVDGMEQQQHQKMYASSALRKDFALHWVNTTRRLLLAACRLIAPTEAHVAELLTEVRSLDDKSPQARGATSASTSTRKRLSATFGPVLRLLLLLAEPDKWKLVAQLNAQDSGKPAANALILIGQSFQM